VFFDDDGLFLRSQVVLIQRGQPMGEGLLMAQVMFVSPMMLSALAMTLSP
jgi:hypothetical protein